MNATFPPSAPPTDAELLGRLEALPIGKPHRRIRVQLGFGYMFDAMDTATVALIMPAVAVAWGLSSSQTGLLGSSVLMGFVVGALTSGAIGDAFGRRRVMLYALLLFCLGSFVGAFSPSWEFLFTSRVITGVGCGAESAIIAVYASEFVSSRHRARFVASIVMFFSFGYITAALLGRFLIPMDDGWRYLQIAGAMPILLLLWWRRSLPESPRYLLAHGRRSEAEDVIVLLEDGDLSPSPAGAGEPSPSTTTRPALPERPTVRQALRRYADLFERGLIGVTLATCFLWFVVFFCFYGFFTWIPSLLIDEGYTVTKSFTFVFLIYAAQLPGYYLAARLFDYVDQKFAMIGFFAFGAVSAYALSQAGSTTSILISACLLSSSMTGVMGGTFTYTPQVFPTLIRSSGMGASAAIGRIGAILAPIIIGASYDSIGFTGVFTMLMAMMAVGALGLSIFGTRTKDKTLEEIEQDALGQVRSFNTDVATHSSPIEVDR